VSHHGPSEVPQGCGHSVVTPWHGLDARACEHVRVRCVWRASSCVLGARCEGRGRCFRALYLYRTLSDRLETVRWVSYLSDARGCLIWRLDGPYGRLPTTPQFGDLRFVCVCACGHRAGSVYLINAGWDWDGAGVGRGGARASWYVECAEAGAGEDKGPCDQSRKRGACRMMNLRSKRKG
jgi:hypothetical protein